MKRKISRNNVDTSDYLNSSDLSVKSNKSNGYPEISKEKIMKKKIIILEQSPPSESLKQTVKVSKQQYQFLGNESQIQGSDETQHKQQQNYNISYESENKQKNTTQYLRKSNQKHFENTQRISRASYLAANVAELDNYNTFNLKQSQDRGEIKPNNTVIMKSRKGSQDYDMPEYSPNIYALSQTEPFRQKSYDKTAYDNHLPFYQQNRVQSKNQNQSRTSSTVQTQQAIRHISVAKQQNHITRKQRRKKRATSYEQIIKFFENSESRRLSLPDNLSKQNTSKKKKKYNPKNTKLFQPEWQF